ncbi:MAG: hypothetical protein ACKVOB_13575 [Sphingomonas sp.]
MRGNASKYADKRMTQAAAETQLRLLLSRATDKAVAAMTADGLARMYACPPRLIETLLLAEQGKRQRRVAQ